MSALEFTIAAVAVVLTGFSKAGLGGGTGILATPLMFIALGPKQALGVMLPLLILCDWGTCLIHHKHWEWKPVLKLLPSCALGIAIGTYFLGKLDIDWLQRIVGVLCIGFCLLPWFKFGLGASVMDSWGRRRHLFLGLLTGFSSTLAHAAGPIGAIYFLWYHFSPRVFVATSALAFTLINLFKMPTYLWLGLIQMDSLIFSLKLAVFIPLGLWLGHLTLQHLNPALFRRIIYAVLFLTGVDLLSGKSLLRLAAS